MAKQLKADLDTLLLVTGAASEALIELYGTRLSVQYKGPGDPVTTADRRANALLVERLAQAFPGLPVVAEESDPASFDRFREAPRVFFVDPLDGTQEFLGRTGEFAVMIGLLERQRAIAGVVHAPTMGLAWAGAVGLGAWRIDTSSGHWERVHVSATDKLAQARVLASRSHRCDEPGAAKSSACVRRPVRLARRPRPTRGASAPHATGIRRLRTRVHHR